MDHQNRSERHYQQSRELSVELTDVLELCIHQLLLIFGGAQGLLDRFQPPDQKALNAEAFHRFRASQG